MLTAIPLLVLAYWLLRWQGRLWRHAIREEAAVALEALPAALQGQVRPLWTGWRVQGQRARVEFRGGLFGYRTQVRSNGRVLANRRSLLTAEEILHILGEGGVHVPEP